MYHAQVKLSYNKTKLHLIRNLAAFTMVEIALAIAIVAFALVAIIGVLPTGLQVQRENREETILTQEAQLWLNLLTRSTTEIGYIIKHVELVERVSSQSRNRFLPNIDYHTSDELLGLLTYPTDLGGNNLDMNRHSIAYVRAINSPLTDQSSSLLGIQFSINTNTAFRYKLICRILNPPVSYTLNTNINEVNIPEELKLLRSVNLKKTLLIRNFTHHILLEFYWPVYLVGDPNSEGANAYRIGRNKKVYEKLCNGTTLATQQYKEPFYYILPITIGDHDL